MMRKDVVIAERFHTREYPISRLIQTANHFPCAVFLESEANRANAKSMLGMLALNLWPGMTVTVVADGPDEGPALDAVDRLLSGT